MYFGNQPVKRNIFESLKASFVGGSPAAPPATPPQEQPVVGKAAQAPVPNPANTEIDPSKVWASLFEEKPVIPAHPNAPVISPWDTSAEALGAKFDGVDFSGVLNPELATKALAGDAAALMQLISQGAQAASMYAVKHSLDTSKLGVEEFGKSFKQTLPSDFKKLSIEQAMVNDPLLSDPLLKPTVDHVANMLYSKFPNASSEDLKTAVQEFLKVQAEKISPKPKQESVAGAIDFKALLG